MIFSALSVFQNILFILALAGVIVLVSYLAVKLFNTRKNKFVYSDDIDDYTESYNVKGFLYNAFKLKGSIITFSFATAFAFFLSLYVEIWLALVLGVIVGVIAAVVDAIINREPLADKCDLAVVSVKIEEGGEGRVIVSSNNNEVAAIAESGSIKKGKKVVIIKNVGDRVMVRKAVRASRASEQ